MYEPEREKRITRASTRLRKSTIRRCRWWVLILVSTLSNLAKLKISRLVPLTVIFGQDQDLQRWTSSALTSWHLLFSHYKTGLPGMSEHVLVTCTQTPTAMGQRRIEYWSWAQWTWMHFDRDCQSVLFSGQRNSLEFWHSRQTMDPWSCWNTC